MLPLLCMAALAIAPSEVYIVSHFSDYHYRILDVTPDGPDTVVRYVRIGPINTHCRRTIVQAAEAGRSPPTVATLLEGYHGPVSAVEVRAATTPRLRNADSFEFTRFAAPKYPPLALQAQIQGNVEFDLAVSPSTGEVTKMTLLRGHPLLVPPAAEAIKSWLFAPNSVPSGTVTVTLQFAIRPPCAP